jgi:hypothetical protein
MKRNKKKKYAVQILNQMDKPFYWETLSRYSSKKRADKIAKKLDKAHAFETYRVKKLRSVV